MRYINWDLFDEKDPDFVKWKKKADCLTASLVNMSAEDRSDFFKTNSIWSDIKPLLKKYFGNKCWYSECSLEGMYADVDHFRPKGKSVDETKKTILEDGYWWLAYDYRNYRLACEISNRPYNGGGKGSFFPLRPGTTAAKYNKSDDIAVLLDPCNPNDIELIACDEDGRIIPFTDDAYEKWRVSFSEKTYNLKEFEFSRKKVIQRCGRCLSDFELDYYDNNVDRMKRDFEHLKEITDHQSVYSSFARKYIRRKIESKPYQNVLLKLVDRD